jgi:hypothetical protein
MTFDAFVVRSGNRFLADDETVRLTANGFEVAQYDSLGAAQSDAAIIGGEAVKARFSMESDEVKVRVL